MKESIARHLIFIVICSVLSGVAALTGCEDDNGRSNNTPQSSAEGSSESSGDSGGDSSSTNDVPAETNSATPTDIEYYMPTNIPTLEAPSPQDLDDLYDSMITNYSEYF